MDSALYVSIANKTSYHLTVIVVIISINVNIIIIIINISITFPSFWCDCGYRGWYNNPQSAPRPATKARPIVQPRCMCQCVCINGALRRQVCDESIEDLVLFIYSVQQGRKFHWLLGLYALNPTGTQCSPSSAHLPGQVIA